jgi:uncharacterized C2H2 Zn-finger protein
MINIDMKYSCIDCNYSTDDCSNWTRHKKSQSHLKKEQSEVISKDKKVTKSYHKITNSVTSPVTKSYHKITNESSDSEKSNSDTESLNNDRFNCPHCDKSFSYKSGLSRHINHMCPKNLPDKKLIDVLKQQNEELKKDKEYLKNTTSDAVAAVKFSTSALSFIMQNYSNAPLLKAMPNYLAIKNDCGERELAVVVCEFYKDGTLVRYLAQFFLDYYKKEKPEEQTFWNTDCSRLSYIVHTIVGDVPGWITDKKGVKLKEQVIKPLFDNIEKELYSFIKNPKNIKNPNVINTCSLLIQDIQSSVICDELIRFLAPHFQLSNYKSYLAIKENHLHAT